jgi:hypothetical protein
MVSENGSSPRRQHDPWNKGRLIGQKRPLKPRDVWTIRVRLHLEGRLRDHGFEGFNFFSFTPFGVAVLVIGVATCGRAPVAGCRPG